MEHSSIFTMNTEILIYTEINTEFHISTPTINLVRSMVLESLKLLIDYGNSILICYWPQEESPKSLEIKVLTSIFFLDQ